MDSHLPAPATDEPPSFEPPDRVEQQVEVRFEYPVVFTRDVFAASNTALAWALSRSEPHRRHRALVVVDAGVARAWPGLGSRVEAYFAAHGARVELAGPVLTVAGGEAVKNDGPLQDRLLETFAQHKLDRQSHVVVVGGGSVLDAVGFAAAVCHRGLRVVRIPTTVLAQNDAGIGVKNGVNRVGQKNFSGTFWPPFAVINDFSWLRTLTERDFRAGYAEAVKVALIRDPSFFTWIETEVRTLATHTPAPAEHLIRRCAELHLQHIREGGDPFELGSARPLDFGHWAAHKLENLSHHELRHGEAVAIGIAIDVEYCARLGLLAASDRDRIHALLRGLGLPLWHPALTLADSAGELRVLAGLQEFREHLGGELTLTLLRGIGVGIEVHEIDRERLVESIESLQPRGS